MLLRVTNDRPGRGISRHVTVGTSGGEKPGLTCGEMHDFRFYIRLTLSIYVHVRSLVNLTKLNHETFP